MAAGEADVPHPHGIRRLSGALLSGRKSNVLENRDLCRIVSSFIPVPAAMVVGVNEDDVRDNVVLEYDEIDDEEDEAMDEDDYDEEED